LTTNPAIMALASNPKAHASIVLAIALLRAVADLLYVIMPKGPQGQKRPAGAIGKVVKVIPIATREKTETATAEEGRNQAAEALGLSIWPAGSGRPGTPRAGLAKIAQDRADDAVLGTGLLLFSLRLDIGAAAQAQRLPTSAFIAEVVRPVC
jgi:hypothetical protein